MSGGSVGRIDNCRTTGVYKASVVITLNDQVGLTHEGVW